MKYERSEDSIAPESAFKDNMKGDLIDLTINKILLKWAQIGKQIEMAHSGG